MRRVAVGSAPGSWESLTVIAALGLDGVRAPWRSRGSTDTAVFESYVEQVLAPELHAGDVVVWDNLSPIRPMPQRRPSGGRVPGPAPAALQPGLHADRETLVEGQGVPPPGRGAEQACRLRGPGRERSKR